jgi:hypothetical protein
MELGNMFFSQKCWPPDNHLLHVLYVHYVINVMTKYGKHRMYGNGKTVNQFSFLWEKLFLHLPIEASCNHLSMICGYNWQHDIDFQKHTPKILWLHFKFPSDWHLVFINNSTSYTLTLFIFYPYFTLTNTCVSQ